MCPEGRRPTGDQCFNNLIYILIYLLIIYQKQCQMETQQEGEEELALSHDAIAKVNKVRYGVDHTYNTGMCRTDA